MFKDLLKKLSNSNSDNWGPYNKPNKTQVYKQAIKPLSPPSKITTSNTTGSTGGAGGAGGNIAGFRVYSGPTSRVSGTTFSSSDWDIDVPNEKTDLEKQFDDVMKEVVS